MCAFASQYRNGYTLLEILVVILLIGLITSLVLPNLNKLYERGLIAYERNNLLRSLSAISYRVYRQNKAAELGGATTGEMSAELLAELPQGWEISVGEPIVYLDNGVCLGGYLTLTNGRLVQHIQLSPPYCQAASLANLP
jgi:general secretion pathway protein G